MPKAYNMSAREAEDFKLPPNSVLISVNEEDRGLYPLNFINRNSEDVLTLIFSDVRVKTPHKGRTLNPISNSQALQVLGFIKKHLGKDFYIHCHAGVSRSGAIAFYLHAAHGYELHPYYWAISQPNPFVLGKLFIVNEQPADLFR